jgi:hypothetical protein
MRVKKRAMTVIDDMERGKVDDQEHAYGQHNRERDKYYTRVKDPYIFKIPACPNMKLTKAAVSVIFHTANASNPI